jgi:hypothetical protein
MRVAVVVAAAILGVGCADAVVEERAAVEERDSAGITIVESRAAPNAGPALRLSAEPVVQIGVVEGAAEYQLDGVQWVTRLSDGTLVVANGGSREIRYYDSAGRHRHTTGRSGAGPGEYRNISYMRRIAGDSVLVFDALNRRITVLDANGAHVRDMSTVAPVVPSADTRAGGAPAAATPEQRMAARAISQALRVAAVLDDGTLLGTGSFGMTAAQNTEFARDTVTFEVVRGDARVPLPLQYAGSERRVQVDEQGPGVVSIAMMSLPYARSVTATATADRFIIGSSHSYQLHVYDGSGTLRTIIRRPDVEPVPVTPALIDRFIDAQIDARRASGADVDEAAARRLGHSYARVDALPAFGPLIGTQSGGVWVKDFVVPGVSDPTERWSAYDASGRLLGGVDVPRGFRPLHVADDVVVGVIADDLDVQYVRVYELSTGHERGGRDEDTGQY